MITGDRESIGDEFGVYSVDDEDQLTYEDTLDGNGDPLDRGYAAPDRLQGATAHGVTAWEQSNDETIDQRLRQETPDPWFKASAKDEDDEDDGFVNGDDADAIRAQLADDLDGRVGRMIAPDEGFGEDREPRLIAREGSPTSWDSPEESAMHYVDQDSDELPEVEWQPSDEPALDEDE